MNKIEWKVTERELKQKLASADNRWHISTTENGHANPAFSLSNYDLFLAPYGTGANYRECFETFIADCDAFLAKVTAVRDEAKAHLSDLIATAESLEKSTQN